MKTTLIILAFAVTLETTALVTLIALKEEPDTTSMVREHLLNADFISEPMDGLPGGRGNE